MKKIVGTFVFGVVVLTFIIAHAGGRAYINGKLVKEKPVPEVKLKEGDFIVNKKGLKNEVLLELGWGDGDYEVGLLEEGVKSGPQSIAVDKNGDIYICDTFNDRVLVYNPSGKYKRQFANRGGSMLTIGDDGNIYTYALSNNVLFEYSNDGVLKRFIDVPNMLSNNLPINIVEKNGDIYILDGEGYQKIVDIEEYKDNYGYKRLRAKLNEYIIGVPFTGDSQFHEKTMADIEPVYAKLGIGDQYGSVIDRFAYKIRPRDFSIEIGDNNYKHVLHIFDENGFDTQTSIILYNNSEDFGIVNWEQTIFIDKNMNVYQLQLTDLGVRVIIWRI